MEWEFMASYTIESAKPGEQSAVERAIAQGKQGDKTPRGLRGHEPGVDIPPELEALAQSEAKAVGEDDILPMPSGYSIDSGVAPSISQENGGYSVESAPRPSPALTSPVANESIPTATPQGDRSTGGNSVRSRGYSEETPGGSPGTVTPKPFHPGQILDYLMSPVDPELRPSIEQYTGKSSLEFLKPETWTPSNLGKSLVGATADALITPMTYLGTPFTGTTKVIPGAKSLIKSPVLPQPISQTELDATIAHRSLTASALDTGAFPDPDLLPLRQKPTGRTLVVPNLNLPQVSHTAEQAGGIVRGAKGQFERMAYPDLLPGEVWGEPGAQQSLLGGYPVEGTAPHLVGKYALGPEEQTNLGMSVLRPQRLLLPEQPVSQSQAYTQFLSKTLKSRILTPEMERTLAEPPELHGGAPVRLTPSKSYVPGKPIPRGEPGGSVSVEFATNEPFQLPKEFTRANTADGAVFPSLYTRVTGSVTDVMRAHGPIGNGIADMVDTAYANRAIGTSTDAIKATQAYDQIFGQTTKAGRAKTMFKQLLAGENAFLNGSAKNWGIDDKLQEQIFNYMYTKGRLKPSDPRAAQAGDALFQNLTVPASSDPGVRMLSLTNPFTGKKQPLGQPDLFMPQQPVHPITSQAIGDTQWRILYERAGGEKLGISQEVYKKTIIKLSQHDPEVTAHKMKGLENMRLLDLEALGGSPYQWAKKLGYETDPFRAAFKFNSMARLRGQLAQVEGPINELLMQVPADADNANKWLHLATDRAMMNPGKYDALGTTTNTLKGISHMLDVTMLQLGGVANMAQAAYIVARGGARASLKGAFDLVSGKDRLLVEQSGATFPAALNEMTNPTGPMATFSSGAFRLYGLSYVDRSTRYFAGHVGNQFIKQVERNLLSNPSNKRLQGLISELGGDPKTLLQQGTLPDEMRLRMIQRFANHTSGVTDVRGTPLWASTENPWARLVNKYRTFAVANSAELRRLVVNAPDAKTAATRVATLLAGAYVIGGGIHEARMWLRDSLLGNEAKPSKNSIARNAERLTQGLGTIEGMFLVNAAQDPVRAVASATGGPGAGVAASFLQDMIATAQYGPGWRTVDTLSKRLPLVGPVVGPLVGQEVRKESRGIAEQRRQLSE